VGNIPVGYEDDESRAAVSDGRSRMDPRSMAYL